MLLLLLSIWVLLILRALLVALLLIALPLLAISIWVRSAAALLIPTTTLLAWPPEPAGRAHSVSRASCAVRRGWAVWLLPATTAKLVAVSASIFVALYLNGRLCGGSGG